MFALECVVDDEVLAVMRHRRAEENGLDLPSGKTELLHHDVAGSVASLDIVGGLCCGVIVIDDGLVVLRCVILYELGNTFLQTVVIFRVERLQRLVHLALDLSGDQPGDLSVVVERDGNGDG